MIPRTVLTVWRTRAPWPGDDQVEQDLVISRALVELYSDELIANSLAFRGGTALNNIGFLMAHNLIQQWCLKLRF